MRGKTFRGAWLLAAWGTLAVGGVRGEGPVAPYKPDNLPVLRGEEPATPFTANAPDSGLSPLPPPIVWRGQQPGQSYAPADPQLPVPLGSTRPEDGGLFLGAEYMFFRQTNPLKEQVVATRGFQASDNSIPGIAAGQLVGSQQQALNVDQLTGQDSYEAGFRITAGWHFGADGSSLTASYFWIGEASYKQAATLAPPGGNVGPNFENTFLFAGVYNFPPQYAGPDQKIVVIDPTSNTIVSSLQANFGIWNGATVMTESFIQRFQEWELTYRQPVCQTEDSRLSLLVGPRFDWIWEGYKWSSTGYMDDGTGNITAGPQTTGIYSTYTSNRMYGVHTGLQYECYLGHGFALLCEGQVALFMDAIHVEANYYLEDKFQGLPESKTSHKLWNVVPEAQGNMCLQWYPYEFIQLQFGYQVMAFFNTLADRQPIDFNYGNANPHWSTYNRLFDGFMAGCALTF